MDEFDIYIQRFAGPGAAAAESGLQRVFGLDARRAREFVHSLPRVVKRHVPAARIGQYERALRALGAEYELRRSPIRPQQIIAVTGEDHDGVDPQLHGSTLTLTLAPPPPAPEAAPPGSDTGARQIRSASQFSATLVDPSPPYGVLLEAAERAARASPAPPVAAVPVAPAAQRTLHEGLAPQSESAVAPDRLANEHVVDPRPASPADAWSSLELEPRAAAALARPAASARAQPTPARAGDEPPAAWQAPGLEISGRPGWLVDPREMYGQGPLAEEARSAPAVGPGRTGPAPESERLPPARQPPFAASAPAASPEPRAATPPGPESDSLMLDERAAPQPNSPRNRVRAPRVNADQAVSAPLGTPIRGAPHAPAIGMRLGREYTDDDEPSALLSFALRFGIGISLFVIVTTVRHCRAFDSDVEAALAAWGEQPSAEIADEAPSAAPAGGYGPPALAWMESDMHQFTSGDKDRARSVVQRYKAAGAREVYVGSIVQSGPLYFAGELIVELPSDPARRKAVLAEHQRVLEGSFGGFAPQAGDPGGPVLRVTL